MSWFSCKGHDKKPRALRATKGNARVTNRQLRNKQLKLTIIAGEIFLQRKREIFLMTVSISDPHRRERANQRHPRQKLRASCCFVYDGSVIVQDQANLKRR
jgi:hypothetical protein